MTTNEWVNRWELTIRKTDHANVWEVQSGGFLIRCRVKAGTTGKSKDIRKVLRDVDAATAAGILLTIKGQVQEFGKIKDLAAQPNERFATFALLHFKKKCDEGDIKSPAGRMKWRSALKTLLGGIKKKQPKVQVDGLGEVYIHALIGPIREWRSQIASAIRQGHYSPNTCNTWLAILRVLTKEATIEFKLVKDPCDGIKDFDVSSHETYTEEEPNAIPPNKVGLFLKLLAESYPQHYAMSYLGFTTGLRTCTLRPLRRSGELSDVKWKESKLVVRRSQTRGEEVMNTTKQKRRYSIVLPDETIKVLEWHVRTQLTSREMRKSELLFPSIKGGFRAPGVLNKPFARISEELDLGFHFTQHGMRRTFNDLSRFAGVNDFVTRSISGHLTEDMQTHYSTAYGSEQKEGLSRVAQLIAEPSESEPAAE